MKLIELFKEISRNIINWVLKKLKLSHEKWDWLKAFINILISLILKLDIEKLNESKEYISSVEKFWSWFEIKKEKFEFILDLLTGDPLRIFKFTPKVPEIDPQRLKFKGSIWPSRSSLISDGLNLPGDQVSKLSALWTYNHNMNNLAKSYIAEDGKPSDFMKYFSTRGIGVDPTFFDILMKYQRASNDKAVLLSLKEDIKEFTSACLKKIVNNSKEKNSSPVLSQRQK